MAGADVAGGLSTSAAVVAGVATSLDIHGHASRRLDDGVLEALAVLACEGDPSALNEVQSSRLLRSLGLSGIEVRCRGSGRVVWRHGGGAVGDEVTSGALGVTAMGGRPREGPILRTLLGLLAMTAAAGEVGVGAEDEDTRIHGSSAAATRLRAELRRIAPTDIAVLILGETGAGKEVAAQAVHRLSGRTGAFVPVNVAAIPKELLEAELFGSVRGAYTGADRARPGLVTAAHRGTLFLDEIGDLDLAMQAKLLRVLESGEVRPVGSTAFHTVDARVVSATHRDLLAGIDDGSFRADLYYRLAPAVVRVPPLRERIEDLPLLRQLFEKEASLRIGLTPCRWSEAAASALLRYHWPGNIRQLRHAVELGMVEARGGVVTRAMLPFEEGKSTPPQRWGQATADFRRRLLRRALHRHGGNRSAAARELGISRQTLLYHLRSLGLGSCNP
jgi:transcriptional regulator with PAS, ATPase and Fis domain